MSKSIWCSVPLTGLQATKCVLLCPYCFDNIRPTDTVQHWNMLFSVNRRVMRCFSKSSEIINSRLSVCVQACVNDGRLVSRWTMLNICILPKNYVIDLNRSCNWSCLLWLHTSLVMACSRAAYIPQSPPSHESHDCQLIIEFVACRRSTQTTLLRIAFDNQLTSSSWTHSRLINCKWINALLGIFNFHFDFQLKLTLVVTLTYIEIFFIVVAVDSIIDWLSSDFLSVIKWCLFIFRIKFKEKCFALMSTPKRSSQQMIMINELLLWSGNFQHRRANDDVANFSF